VVRAPAAPRPFVALLSVVLLGLGALLVRRRGAGASLAS
jgi:hypothetical protein